eukprot:7898936-Pyramimonas_sp.AAC.1
MEGSSPVHTSTRPAKTSSRMMARSSCQLCPVYSGCGPARVNHGRQATVGSNHGRQAIAGSIATGGRRSPDQ